MSSLLEIEKAIESLPAGDFRELHRWIADRDSQVWESEIAADSTAGKFEEIRRRVRRDYEAGQCTDL